HPSRAIFSLLTCTLSVLLLLGCSESDTTQVAGASESVTDRQTAFRVRSDFDAPLIEDGGWASDTNQTATVLADQPFRLRFEVQAAEAGNTERRYQLEV